MCPFGDYTGQANRRRLKLRVGVKEGFLLLIRIDHLLLSFNYASPVFLQPNSCCLSEAFYQIPNWMILHRKIVGLNLSLGSCDEFLGINLVGPRFE